MSLAIENPQKLELASPVQQVLSQMFAGYRQIIVRKEFVGGLSGGRVFEVQPIKANAMPELPVVVKFATLSLIQKEWQAYQAHIHRRLPYIGEVNMPPVLLPEIGWGGLYYSLMGADTFEVMSLYDYCRRTDTTTSDVEKALERLFRVMRHLWGYNHTQPDFQPHPSYDPLLPVNCLIRQQSLSPEEAGVLLTPETASSTSLSPGARIRASGFAVVKANPVTQTVTLNRPEALFHLPSFFLRYKFQSAEAVVNYQAHQLIDLFEGEVIETRFSRLYEEIHRAFNKEFDLSAPTLSLGTGEESRFANPLVALETLLSQASRAKIASIHGDFNLGNILIEPETGFVSLIDFAEAREDHVLHDFLRLETELVTKLIPEILCRHHLPLSPVLASLYWQLHCLAGPPSLAHPDMEKAWVMLKTIRQVAREYLVAADEPAEYYRSLLIYLLGALKFKNLDTLPEYPLTKQAAFWGAIVVYQLLAAPSAHPEAPPAALVPLLTQFQRLLAASPASLPPLKHGAAITLAEAEQRLVAMPLGSIPTLSPLPPRSRMPLSRNPLFVGRQQDLQALARALKGSEPMAIGQVETAALTGLGGIGKSQLASEFVHRYGQFFAGGVFWLSFADPKAVPAEIAACGGLGALELRPDFDKLSLEDQIRLVMAAWQEPTPRLLIFDNCEDPELLAHWRPTSGGSRVLVTSRRADWEARLGVHALPLAVLERIESMTLLRKHRPDASDAILDVIAAEVGDLPLALHVAGSYLARYRRVISPEEYLEQLRQRNLLQHPSFDSRSLSPTAHIQNVYRTFALSYKQLNPADETDA